MAIMKSFQAYRPAKQYVEDIAALPYDVYDRLEARREVEGKPLSFLNIDRPETQFAPDYDMYAPEVYQKAHDMLERFSRASTFRTKQSAFIYMSLPWRAELRPVLLPVRA